MDIMIPQAIVQDHKEIQAGLDKAIMLGGLVGQAAAKVMAAMKPHAEFEEKYALPPLGLLPALVAGKLDDNMDAASEMADDLKGRMPKMLDEHKKIDAALDEMSKAAAQDNKPEYAELVKRLKLHIQEEEQVYYPAALLVGAFLKVKLATLVQFRFP